MTQKQKDLVMKDLCGRLPYGVYVQVVDRVGFTHTWELNPEVIQKMWTYKSIKPYLRPMSSMSKEEKVEYGDRCYYTLNCIYKNQQYYFNQLFDWLNEKMFDYRGLIPRGCAIAVTEDNNPYKK